MTSVLAPPVSTMTALQLADLIDRHADDLGRDYSYEDPMAAQMRAGAARIRHEGRGCRITRRPGAWTCSTHQISYPREGR